MMSFMRLFMETVWLMAKDGQWALIAAYIAALPKVGMMKEAVITTGTPTDKPV
jgi:hypothetical protein